MKWSNLNDLHEPKKQKLYELRNNWKTTFWELAFWKYYVKVAPYSFLKSGKHIFQTQNQLHWYFVRRMKQTVWYRTAFWESETATKKCVTVVVMATKTFPNGC